MKTIPLTVLVHEGPMSRAYLSALRAADLVPERLIHLIWKRHTVTRTGLTSWLPTFVQRRYASWHQAAANNFWPRKLLATQPGLARAIQQQLRSVVDDPDVTIAHVAGRFDPAHYPDYRQLFVDRLGDPQLADALSAVAPTTVLFTGGGIVPQELLGIPGIRFLHVHPGFLPHVRGADGLLWSVLLRGKPGASAFFMANGIDTGDVIISRDYPEVSFDLGRLPRPDDETLYRALYSFYDPMIRANLLVQTLQEKGSDLTSVQSTAQNLSEGVTYHFMHAELRRRALNRLFPRGND